MKPSILTRLVCALLTLMLIALCVPSCAEAEDNGKINIVCTVFPQYDWLRNIIGEDNDRVQLKLIVKNGADLHSYAATARDIVDISGADMLVYVGGDSDAWVKEAISAHANNDMIKIDLLSLIGDRALCADGEHSHEEHSHSHIHDTECGSSYDEHLWLSLKNASLLCSALTQKLCELDPDGKESYLSNADAYIKKLDEMDALYEQTVSGSPRDTVLFADRFPFIYLMRDYGINYHAAFSGCSADSEASFEVVMHLARELDKLALSYVLTVDTGSTAIADSVISASSRRDCGTLSLCSMQSIRQSDIDAGTSYLSIMEENRMVLRTALS